MQQTTRVQRTVVVVPSQADWPVAFAKARTEILQALGEIVYELHHIGSTAVPGLAAKPILDLLLEVTDLNELDAKTQMLLTLGYHAKGENGIPGRRYFYKGDPSRTHHLHAFVVNAPLARQHLLFRDFLRTNPAAASQYATLKLELASQFPEDNARYQAGKDAFIVQLLQQAAQYS